MNHKYIKINRIYQKLKKAQEQNQVLYITAPVGIGKTEAVKYFYRNQQVLWLSGENGTLSEMPSVEEILQDTVIIDDICWIKDNTSKNYINQLIDTQEKHIVMMSRSRLPEWLKKSCVKHFYLMTDYTDFQMNIEEIKRLLGNFQINVDKETLLKIREDTQGNVLLIMMIAYRMQSGNPYSEIIKEAAKHDTYQYYDVNLFDKWSFELGELLIALSNFDYFDIELAEMLCESNNVFSLLNEAFSVGDFLIKHENGSFKIWLRLKEYLQYRQFLYKDKEYLAGIFKKAVTYYEKHNRQDLALFYCEKIGNEEEIIRLLKEQADCHVGIGHYFETRNYYFGLSEEQIEKDPVLMAGLSTLYSLMLQPELSEKWYQKLKEYESNPSLSREEKREAQKRLLHLDISLPHRGTVKMTDLLKTTAAIITKKGFSLPDLSATSNLPSIMNGGKDFCEWSKSDKELYCVMKKPIEIVLDKWGAGFVDISLAESQFEKGSDDIYEIMTLLNGGYIRADLGGKIEMCFAAAAILCRIEICRNNMKTARNQMTQFKTKAISENAGRLVPNIEAMENGFDLFEGKIKEVEIWIENKAPDESQDFYILNRYQYIVKVRSYMACGRYEEALNLLQRLSVYFKSYKRTYMDMEAEILKAILEYRMKIGDYKKTLFEVLPRIESYHFIYIIAKEGTAIREVLQEISFLPVSADFEQEMRKAIDTMALYYPNYLKVQEMQDKNLTEIEKKILHLYMEGISSKEVCNLCNFTYNTLKFHNKNMYKKLGVSNRLEAERVAKNYPWG